MNALARGAVFLSCIAVGIYAVGAYSLLPIGAVVHPDLRPGFFERQAVVMAHVFPASLALLLGPLQFWSRLRRARPSIHRWTGRLYCAAVLAGGISGLQLAWHAQGGIVAQAGFATLAVAWLLAGLRAYLAIRNGDVQAHRDWMMRNFSLTFAAVTLRICVPAAMMSGMTLQAAYPVIAWLCWIPNLVVAQWLITRRRAA